MVSSSESLNIPSCNWSGTLTFLEEDSPMEWKMSLIDGKFLGDGKDGHITGTLVGTHVLIKYCIYGNSMLHEPDIV